MAETGLLVARAYRLLGYADWAARWLDRAMETAHHLDAAWHLSQCCEERALLVEADGHHFLTDQARRQARQWRDECG